MIAVVGEALLDAHVDGDEFRLFPGGTSVQHRRRAMMNVGLHRRIVGKPGRAPALDRFLAHVKQKPDVWVTTRAEIARHWHAAHPPR
jgi:allantoinase